MDSSAELMPAIPLKNTVVFPGQTIRLTIGREQSRKALDSSDGLLVVITQRDSDLEEPAPDDLFQTGTLARVEETTPGTGGTIQLTIRGEVRVSVESFENTGPFMMVRAVNLEDGPDTEQTQQLAEVVVDRYRAYSSREHGLLPKIPTMNNGVGHGRLADILASRLGLSAPDAQDLLQAVDIPTRLQALDRALVQLAQIRMLRGRIVERVKQSLEQNQKEYYLREQLRVIRDELGIDGDPSGSGQLRSQISDRGLPELVEARAVRELDRLLAMPETSPETAVIRNYLDWILDLPWDERTEDQLDLGAALEILNEDHYGLDEVKERILEFLAVRKLTGQGRGPILCLVGPPGVGKTSLARSVARALGRKFTSISLGGIRDEAEIRGHRRTYVGSMPGRIINGIRQAGSANPVFLLDEIDKVSSDYRGDPSAALLEALDPEQNDRFSDHFLDMAFDLSQVIFLTTANNPHTIPAPLLDRMEIIHIAGYTEEEKQYIGRGYLLPRQMKRHGLSEDDFSLSDDALRLLIRSYSRESGVRQMERALASICRKIAHGLVEGNGESPVITAASLSRFLGPPQVRHQERPECEQVGMINGLGWTERGGELMPVEASVVPGTGRLILTGHLGEVMRESAQTALTFVRSRAADLGLDPRFYEELDIHIHFPDGTLPKEGPSAGVAMVMAMVSALTGLPIPPDVAVTGEISLRGNVLPVGGLREKILAALRADVPHVIVPAENQAQIEEVDPELRARMTIATVGHLDQVLDLVFGDRLPTAP